MKLRALGSVLSALVACGLVSMVVTDPLTTVEAVPESSPSPTSTAPVAPVAPVARNVDLPRDANGEIDVTGAMAMMTAVVDGWVREHPEQWLWLHRRWR